MNAELVPAVLLVVAIVAQALWPSQRVLIVLLAAGLAVLTLAGIGVARPAQLLSDLPWDVLILLVALGAISQLFAEARLFERIAVFTARHGAAKPSRIVIVFGIVMYAVSGLVNNLTALLLVLPVLLVLLRLTGTTARHARWVVSVLLVCCNLGGAATPIGDFPAILLLGAGAMSFTPYLARAFPATLVALTLLLTIVALVVRPARDVPESAAMRRLTIAVIEALHRRLRVRPRFLVPAAAVLLTMLVVWATVPATMVPPELVAWLGVPVALFAVRKDAMRLVRRSVDVDSTLFLFALFILVGCVQATGMFGDIAGALTSLPLAPGAKLIVFLVIAGLLTGLFSAGPSMAALLVVARSLAGELPPDAVYVGLALSVCAGSSLFLTAATSGPLAQSLVDASGLEDRDGRPVRFGFAHFLPTGLLSFAVIELVAVAWGLLRVSI